MLDSMLKLSQVFFVGVCFFLDVFCNIDVIEKENHVASCRFIPYTNPLKMIHGL